MVSILDGIGFRVHRVYGLVGFIGYMGFIGTPDLPPTALYTHRHQTF